MLTGVLSNLVLAGKSSPAPYFSWANLTSWNSQELQGIYLVLYQWVLQALAGLGTGKKKQQDQKPEIFGDSCF